MTRRLIVEHEFVTALPGMLEEGKVYISIKFRTAAHKCMCGCGLEVVTPIRPTDWHLMFDGETISLRPSIGNWGFPCESHYFITNNRVVWAGRMTKAEIERGRAYDAMAKDRYFQSAPAPVSEPARPATSAPAKPKGGRLANLRRWFS